MASPVTQPSIKEVAVFCGASVGNDPIFVKHAEELGRILGENGVSLIYGAGRLGIMGKLADAALEAGGKVIGVKPDFLFQELTHEGLSELIKTTDMNSRKQIMFTRYEYDSCPRTCAEDCYVEPLFSYSN
jgi:uncharacterized protein (TIGR00730 family)